MNKLMKFKEMESDFHELELKLSEIGKEFYEKLACVRPCKNSLIHWGELVSGWANDESVPLYMRKFNESYPRGSVIKHKSGRTLIPCDNSVAHWSFSMCFNSKIYSLDEIKFLIKHDAIPIAMVLKRSEKLKAKYFRTSHDMDGPNKKGWKVSHKVPIGLKSKVALEDLDIEQIKNHFRNFLNPQNIFLFPKKYAGLAEIDGVLDSF